MGVEADICVEGAVGEMKKYIAYYCYSHCMAIAELVHRERALVITAPAPSPDQIYAPRHHFNTILKYTQGAPIAQSWLAHMVLPLKEATRHDIVWETWLKLLRITIATIATQFAVHSLND